MSELPMMRLAYRDDGILTLCWLVVSSLWKRGHSATFPPAGFVGLVSSLSAATDPKPYRLSSIALRRIPITHTGQRWRLTFGWEISPPRSQVNRSGELSGIGGATTFLEEGGEDGSELRT